MHSVQTKPTMKTVFYFVALTLGSAWTDMAGECDMAGFYLELGCSAVPPGNSTACPDAFQCPDLHPDPTMCYYRGVPYGDRSTIPQALIQNPCSQACRCRAAGEPRFECAAVDCVEVFSGDLQQCVSTYELESCCSTGNVCGDRSTIPQALIQNPCSQACRCRAAGEPRFECAAVDCVEVFSGDLQQCVSTYELESCCSTGNVCGDRSTIPQALIQNPCSQACRCRAAGEPRFECAAVDCVEVFSGDLQQCVSTYELESCCSTGNVCGKDAIANLKTCEVDGQTYMEGQTFEPKNAHKTCICTAEWNGSTDNPNYCRDINCGIEIHYQEKLLDNCAPVFVGDRRSCPIGFTCPTPTSRVVRGLNVRGVNSECVFGNMTLGVGDEVTATEKCTTCACVVPPFVSCMMKSSCSDST